MFGVYKKVIINELVYIIILRNLEVINMEDKKINIEGLSMEKFLDQFNPGTRIR